MASSTLSLAEFEKAMIAVFKAQEFDEADFDKIQRLLALVGKKDWSLRPRTYTVLRLIDRVDLLDAFIVEGLKDIAFPYSLNQLPPALNSQSVRFKFLERQQVVLTKATDLEIGGSHRHFGHNVDSHFINLGLLGRGGFGEVHHLQSKLSMEQYARKRIHRKKAFLKNKSELALFENELKILKRLSHRHLVQFRGSYTDLKYIGILMSPVADCDLKVFLDRRPLPAASCVLLRGFFGCLAAALTYLHEQKLKHKDIKPQNILIKDQTVLITDFGCARDWSSQTKSTTTGLPDALTREYAAPELIIWESRGTSADIWSLGCVFLDMVESLNGCGPHDRIDFLKRNGTEQIYPATNLAATLLWLEKPFEGGSDTEPFSWIRKMLREDRNDRILASTLFEEIQSFKGRHAYCSHCCSNDETSDSDTSYEPSIFEQRLQLTELSEIPEGGPSTGSKDLAGPNPSTGFPRIEADHLAEDPVNGLKINGKLLGPGPIEASTKLAEPTSSSFRLEEPVLVESVEQSSLGSAPGQGQLIDSPMSQNPQDPQDAPLSPGRSKNRQSIPRSSENTVELDRRRSLDERKSDRLDEILHPEGLAMEPFVTSVDEVVELGILTDDDAKLFDPDELSEADKSLALQSLRKAGAPSTNGDLNVETLFWAVEEGAVFLVNFILSERLPWAEIPDGQQRTPLQIACARGFTMITSILLKAFPGAINTWDKTLRSPMEAACEGGHAAIVSMLLDAGAPVEGMRTIAPTLTSQQSQQRETAARANILAKVWTPGKTYTKLGHGYVTATIPAHPPPRTYLTPLQFAVLGHHVEVAQLLIAWNADPLASCVTEKSPLGIAIDEGSETTAIKMLDQPRCRLMANERLDGFLVQATDCALKLISLKLIEAGAKNRSDWGRFHNSLSNAIYRNLPDVVQALMKSNSIYDKTITGTGHSPIADAVAFGNAEIVNSLLDNEPGLQTGTDFLYDAIRGGHESLVISLLARGADVEQGDGVLSPLYLAASTGNIRMASLLLANGANPNAVTKLGETPLYIASYSGHTSIVQKLLEFGASPAIGRADKRLPIHEARGRNYDDIVAMLEEAGNVKTTAPLIAVHQSQDISEAQGPDKDSTARPKDSLAENDRRLKPKYTFSFVRGPSSSSDDLSGSSGPLARLENRLSRQRSLPGSKHQRSTSASKIDERDDGNLRTLSEQLSDVRKLPDPTKLHPANRVFHCCSCEKRGIDDHLNASVWPESKTLKGYVSVPDLFKFACGHTYCSTCGWSEKVSRAIRSQDKAQTGISGSQGRAIGRPQSYTSTPITKPSGNSENIDSEDLDVGPYDKLGYDSIDFKRLESSSSKHLVVNNQLQELLHAVLKHWPSTLRYSVDRRVLEKLWHMLESLRSFRQVRAAGYPNHFTLPQVIWENAVSPELDFYHPIWTVKASDYTHFKDGRATIDRITKAHGFELSSDALAASYNTLSPYTLSTGYDLLGSSYIESDEVWTYNAIGSRTLSHPLHWARGILSQFSNTSDLTERRLKIMKYILENPGEVGRCSTYEHPDEAWIRRMIIDREHRVSMRSHLNSARLVLEAGQDPYYSAPKEAYRIQAIKKLLGELKVRSAFEYDEQNESEKGLTEIDGKTSPQLASKPPARVAGPPPQFNQPEGYFNKELASFSRGTGSSPQKADLGPSYRTMFDTSAPNPFASQSESSSAPGPPPARLSNAPEPEPWPPRTPILLADNTSYSHIPRQANYQRPSDLDVLVDGQNYSANETKTTTKKSTVRRFLGLQ